MTSFPQSACRIGLTAVCGSMIWTASRAFLIDVSSPWRHSARATAASQGLVALVTRALHYWIFLRRPSVFHLTPTTGAPTVLGLFLGRESGVQRLATTPPFSAVEGLDDFDHQSLLVSAEHLGPSNTNIPI
jgi:hypothetical protein